MFRSHKTSSRKVFSINITYTMSLAWDTIFCLLNSFKNMAQYLYVLLQNHKVCTCVWSFIASYIYVRWIYLSWGVWMACCVRILMLSYFLFTNKVVCNRERTVCTSQKKFKKHQRYYGLVNATKLLGPLHLYFFHDACYFTFTLWTKNRYGTLHKG